MGERFEPTIFRISLLPSLTTRPTLYLLELYACEMKQGQTNKHKFNVIHSYLFWCLGISLLPEEEEE